MENIDLSSQSKLIGKRYQLLEKIGEGGMGVVYLAHDRLNNETVALKQVQLTPDEKSSHHSPPQSVMMLRQFLATEFELLASLRHPHIIAVRDYGFDRHGQPYYTMAYLPEAQTLREASQDLSIPEKLTLIQQVLQALAYLHRRGVLHRDIKPANILVVNGEARLLDFGMAQRTAEANKTPSAGGTMVYLSLIHI